jgi:hypothetical protein
MKTLKHSTCRSSHVWKYVRSFHAVQQKTCRERAQTA